MPSGIYPRTPELRRAQSENLAKGHLPEARAKAVEKLRALGQSQEWRARVAKATKKALYQPEIRARHLLGTAKWQREHGLNFRGGNGMPPVLAEQNMADLMAPLGFQKNIIIKTNGHGTGLKCPLHYKPDLANPETRTVIELDGPAHRPMDRREQDARKTQILEALGWRVIRIKHQ